jgi:uncharacterized protein YegL
MPQFKQDPLPPVNPGERHIPAVILVDNSGSMDGAPIEELNQGLKNFGNALLEDSLARGRAEICIISFNSNVRTEMSFRPAADYVPPVLSAGGLTVLNQAIINGLDVIEMRKAQYKKKGISYYRPWLFLLTDGAPTDNEYEADAKKKLRDAISNKKVVYMPMGVGQYADTKKLQEYYPEGTENKVILRADANRFKEAFVWLSSSISMVTRSNPDITDHIELPPTPNNITVGL